MTDTSMQASKGGTERDSEPERAKKQASGRRMLLLVILVCAAPIILSYLTYYVIKPTARNNYGALIDPRQHPIPATLGLTTLDGKPATLDSLKGKWIMLQSGPSDCAEACQQQLFAMRQLRLMQGKEMERIERVWLITDPGPIETMIMRQLDGMEMYHVEAGKLARWLPVEQGGKVDQHLYLIDPLGNLMMRFPKNADPSKVKKDLYKLLKASAIG